MHESETSSSNTKNIFPCAYFVKRISIAYYSFITIYYLGEFFTNVIATKWRNNMSIHSFQKTFFWY